MAGKATQGWRRLAIAAAALAVVLVLVGEAAGEDWPQFRGIHRDGVSPEKGLLAGWPDGGPREVWRVPLGEGYSGIAVVGDRLYTMYAADHDGEPTEFAAAFEVATGKEVWRVPVGKKHDTEFGNGPRSTPTVDGDAVFVLGSFGDLAALSTKDGSERWKLSLTETFGSKQPHWGFSTSALVDGDQVIVEGGGPEGKSYAALDRKTGDVKWTFGEGGPGYNSALHLKLNGKTRYVYVAGEKLTCLDRDGTEVWAHPWPKGETHATPLFVPPDRIFASGAEGVGAKLFRVSENGEKGTVEQLWETRFMRNHFSSSVLHDEHVYGFDNATLKCMSLDEGKLAWAKRGLGKGSLILAEDRLVVLSDSGKLLLVEATPSGFVERGTVQALEGRCWTAPTLANGRLYLRNHEVLVAYDLKG